MTRTLSAGMVTHLAQAAQTPARMVRIDLVDGTTLAITDHDRDLAFDLGDGSVTYSAGTGMLPSDLALSTGFDADDIEIAGPVTEDGLTTLAALLGGRFDDAVVRVFEVNWSDLTSAAAKLLKGYVVQASVEGSRFKLTCHSEISRFQQVVGDVSTPYCRYRFGAPRCGATPSTLAATVTGVTDERAFSVSYAGTYANDAWNRGMVTFLTGGLAGTRPVEIFDFTSGGAGAGSLALWTGLAAAPTIGDTLTITQGCGHTRPDCVEIQGDAVNFGGEPDLPGQDRMLSYPNPGSS